MEDIERLIIGVSIVAVILVILIKLYRKFGATSKYVPVGPNYSALIYQAVRGKQT